jgi:hypothetical protein
MTFSDRLNRLRWGIPDTLPRNSDHVISIPQGALSEGSDIFEYEAELLGKIWNSPALSDLSRHGCIEYDDTDG